MRRSSRAAPPAHRPRWRAGATAAALGWLAVALTAPVAASPLHEAAISLACGEREEVEQALRRLAAAPTARYGVPDESMTGTDDALATAIYDTLLDALATARRRHPDLATKIDELVASWDFCALTAGAERWELLARDDGLWRVAPATPSPLQGRGFAAWGLLPRLARGRPVWSDSGQTGAPQEPEVCALPPAEPSPPRGSLPALPPPSFERDEACEGPPPPPASSPLSTEAASIKAPARRPPRRPVVAAAAPQDDPSETASPATRDALSQLPGTLAVSATLSAAGTANAGASLSIAPVRQTFVRIGVSWRLMTEWEESAALEPTWSWGLGYDDWRTGTFSLQLNHWGPLRRLPGWSKLESAVLNLGYKVPLPAPLARRLSARVDLSTPLSWAPSLGVGLSLKLPLGCFAAVGASQKLAGPWAPTWSYVIGRSLWKPGSLSVVLANYGPNLVPALNPRGIALTVSWSWSL